MKKTNQKNEKKFIVTEIKRLIKQTDNLTLLHLVYLVLLKADKIDLSAGLSDIGTSDNN